MTKHTDEEINAAADRFDEWSSKLTRDDFEDASDLRDLDEAVDAARASEARVRALVQAARDPGRNWGQIGTALGVTRQSARDGSAPRSALIADPRTSGAG